MRSCSDCGAALHGHGNRKHCRRCVEELRAAKNRAYYEANKDEIAAKKRRSLTCNECGTKLREPADLCGFCIGAEIQVSKTVAA